MAAIQSAAHNLFVGRRDRPGDDGAGSTIQYLGNDVIQMPSVAAGPNPRKCDQTHEDANNDNHADCGDEQRFCIGDEFMPMFPPPFRDYIAHVFPSRS